ncbi:hypothetical protein D3C78_1755950 [compost metagenome]
MAWQARLRSSSKVRGLGPVCAARNTAGCERARHQRAKPRRVVRARIKVLSCHGHSGYPLVLRGSVLAGLSALRAGLSWICRLRAGRLLCSR